jgi:hypothetical protein
VLAGDKLISLIEQVMEMYRMVASWMIFLDGFDDIIDPLETTHCARLGNSLDKVVKKTVKQNCLVSYQVKVGERCCVEQCPIPDVEQIM